MGKRTVEIDDTLEDNVAMAIEEVEQELKNYLEENDSEKCPDIGDLDYSGVIHEIVDGCVPIMTREIADTWYLYSSELERAYEQAGVGDNARENDGMAAIYYYIMAEVYAWWDENAEDVFDAWVEEKTAKFKAQLLAFVRTHYPEATEEDAQECADENIWTDEDDLDQDELDEFMKEKYGEEDDTDED